MLAIAVGDLSPSTEMPESRMMHIHEHHMAYCKEIDLVRRARRRLDDGETGLRRKVSP
jgi:hypothetical protein